MIDLVAIYRASVSVNKKNDREQNCQTSIGNDIVEVGAGEMIQCVELVVRISYSYNYVKRCNAKGVATRYDTITTRYKAALIGYEMARQCENHASDAMCSSFIYDYRTILVRHL